MRGQLPRSQVNLKLPKRAMDARPPISTDPRRVIADDIASQPADDGRARQKTTSKRHSAGNTKDARAYFSALTALSLLIWQVLTGHYHQSVVSRTSSR